MCSTCKPSITMDYCKAYPHHVKEIIDSGNGHFKAMPLASAVGDFFTSFPSDLSRTLDGMATAFGALNMVG